MLRWLLYADVAELVDALDLGSSIERCESSSLSVRTSIPLSESIFFAQYVQIAGEAEFALTQSLRCCAVLVWRWPVSGECPVKGGCEERRELLAPSGHQAILTARLSNAITINADNGKSACWVGCRIG